MQKYFFIVNPVSSYGKTGKRWQRIKEQLEAEGLSFAHELTREPGHAADLSRDALRNGYNILVSVGGDGTLNEVVNGFFAVDQETRERASLGVISTGTGGDFVRSLQLPRDIPEAAQRIARGQVRRLDIGLINFARHDGETEQRYFCNIADVGLGGFMVSRARHNSRVLGGLLFFLLSTIGSIILYRNQDLSAVIDDCIRWRGKAVVFVAGNGQYFGGGMRITPLAILDDGLLDFLLIKDMPKLRLLANLYRVYRGNHLKIAGVELFRGKKVRIESPADILLEMDGEQPGKTPVEIGILPKALRFIV